MRRGEPSPSRRARWLISALALIVGTVGGIYGISGGSLLAPILLVAGFTAYEVAPATLVSTFLTSPPTPIQAPAAVHDLKDLIGRDTDDGPATAQRVHAAAR